MKTTAQFVQDAHQAHGDKYDYSKVSYIGANKKVEIVCPEHGSFWQGACSHLRGHGCPECKRTALKEAFVKRTDEFIQDARQAHGDKYDYSQAEYTGAKSKVKIICPKHGPFMQAATNHTAGRGCHKCANEARRTGRLKDRREFIERSTATHSGFYDYSQAQYTGMTNRVKIICPKHGVFEQVASYHINGAGCPKCGTEKTANAKRHSPIDFIIRADEVHKGKYDYSKIEYKNAQEKVEIVCPKHGSFWQGPYTHLQGVGCPNCSTMISKGEQEVFDFIVSRCTDDAEQQYKIGRKSFDIRAGKCLIEYQGLYWHSNRNRTEQEAKWMHHERRVLAEENGFRYVAIYEDEWRDTPEKVRDYLLNLFGRAPKAGARQFQVKPVTTKEARAFYEAHHLLGAGSASGSHMALVDDDQRIAACMSIGRATEHRGQTDGTLSLSRFCTDGRAIAGAATRLFKALDPQGRVVSYVDLDKFTGGVYRQLGFAHESDVEPDYMTLWGNSSADMHRKHKTATKRSALSKLPGFDPSISERENCLAMGIFRVYHSGRVKMAVEPSSHPV